MSSKSKPLITTFDLSQTSTSDLGKGQRRSLRLQLTLWYGTLIAISLGIFAFFFLWLTTEAIYQNIDEALLAESRIALYDIHDNLQQDPSLSTYFDGDTIDVYRNQDVAIEIIDREGNSLYYSSHTQIAIPRNKEVIAAALAGQQPPPRTENVADGSLRVGVYPITTSPNEKTVIGAILVAKSLKNINETFLLLQTLLLLSGLTAMIIALASGWAITAKVLQSLAEIVKTARAIASTVHGTHIGSLSQRVQRPQGIGEMVQVVDTFNEMLDALESATQAQRRFVADASHELRAPLTTVQGNLAFLQRHLDELPPDERKTMLSDAHGETLRLARLVDELLLLARADANTSRPIALQTQTEKGSSESRGYQERLIEIDHVVLQLVRQLRGRLNVEGSKLRLEVGHVEPMRAIGDEESLRRVVLILIDNALKYTPEGEEQQAGRVTVSLERVGKEAVIHVRDTGIGIEPSDLPHIFERFYRADKARSRKGTGLGLSISQMLVEQLGGRITAQSTPGKGSTFSVWLPHV